MNEALFLVAQCKIVIPEIMYKKKTTNCTQLCKCMCVFCVCANAYSFIRNNSQRKRGCQFESVVSNVGGVEWKGSGMGWRK